MDSEFYQTIAQLKLQKKPFSVATVISVRGSTSAKPGSKAVISQEGKNLLGWIGGGCAEKYICEESLESLKTGQTKIVEVDLDDEIFGLGMPCGGVMQVFIEPFLEPLNIRVACEGLDLEKAIFLAPRFQMEISSPDTNQSSNKKSLENADHAINQFAGSLKGFEKIFMQFALARSTSFFPDFPLRTLQEVKGVMPHQKSELKVAIHDLQTEAPHKLVILGHSRISEELAQLAGLLGWSVSVYSNSFESEINTENEHQNLSNYPHQTSFHHINWNQPAFDFPENSFVLVASHHKGDPEFIQAALKKNAKYIGLVASAKRSGLVFEDLIQKSMNPKSLQKIHAPAGFEIQSITPAHIALSIISEMIFTRHCSSENYV